MDKQPYQLHYSMDDMAEMDVLFSFLYDWFGVSPEKVAIEQKLVRTDIPAALRALYIDFGKMLQNKSKAKPFELFQHNWLISPDAIILEEVLRRSDGMFVLEWDGGLEDDDLKNAERFVCFNVASENQGVWDFDCVMDNNNRAEGVLYETTSVRLSAFLIVLCLFEVGWYKSRQWYDNNNKDLADDIKDLEAFKQYFVNPDSLTILCDHNQCDSFRFPGQLFSYLYDKKTRSLVQITLDDYFDKKTVFISISSQGTNKIHDILKDPAYFGLEDSDSIGSAKLL